MPGTATQDSIPMPREVVRYSPVTPELIYTPVPDGPLRCVVLISTPAPVGPVSLSKTLSPNQAPGCRSVMEPDL
ncbi:hypothetical protein EYF80_049260 [Liparis tanakae]|uniref:Uncharacterized protein n=1 Tax=Liparis tanakae TaxID=230148 RepID=A0A4Z2FHD9_9TELE|nr:hypothetical protein EYF80_049260 [Liparis tanakae]